VFNEVVAKDSSKLQFHFQRACTYLHPRTSMLMFGPKNATARQVQYLHIPEWVDKESSLVTVANLNKLHPISNAIVMTATQFEGIPMADVFKVYMYWTFEAVRTAEEQSECSTGERTGEATAASLCRVRMGLRVDYLKSTMLKSQIFAGTKEELVVLCKQWEQFHAGELAADSRRHAAAVLSSKGEDSFYSDSEVSCDSDDETDGGGRPPQVSTKEQVTQALLEHDKKKLARQSASEDVWTPSPMLSGLVVVVLIMQFVLLLLAYRKMSYLEGLVESIASEGNSNSKTSSIAGLTNTITNTNSEL
jgi:hypothetical protein